jgi:hypothetical protein
MRKLHTATVPRHKPSTMRFLSKSFGMKVKSAGAIKSTVKKIRTTRGRRP